MTKAKHTALLLLFTFHFSLFTSLSAAVPVRWTVETTGATPATFEAYQGETLAFEAALKSHGMPLAAPAQYSIFWQTNGMGSAYWSTACEPVARTNVMFATWSPSMDVGARVYNCFIGEPGEIYRAAFQLRLRPSPGASPAYLSPPVKVLDFETVEIANAPWPAAIAASTNALDENLRAAIASGDAATLAAANAYTDAHGGGGSSGGVDTNAVRDIAGEVADAKLSGYLPLTGGSMTGHLNFGNYSYIGNGTFSFGYEDLVVAYDKPMGGLVVSEGLSGVAVYGPRSIKNVTDNYEYYYPNKDGTFAMTSDIPDVPEWAKSPTKPSYSAAEVGAASSSEVDEIANAVQVISVHLNAEDARDVVTNYDSVTKMPSRRLEYKIPDGPDAGTWRVVWDELTRFNFLVNLLGTNYYNKAQVDAKTDHIPWGVFDSQTGGYSPEKTVQMSSDRVILCKGASYQRTVTTGGPTYWVWTSNEPYEVGGIESNGYFQVSDPDGNVAFKVVSGERLTVPATCVGNTTFNEMGITHLVLRYPVIADAHPTIYVCDDLVTKQWKSEDDPDCLANVAWTGTSGNYTGEVWLKVRPTNDKLFVRATYERTSEPYVMFGRAMSLQTLKIGDAVYNVGTAVIDGKTVLTLTPHN